MKTLKRLYSGYCCYGLQRAHCCSLNTAHHYPPLALILKLLPTPIAAVSETVYLSISHGIHGDPIALQILSEVCLASDHKGFLHMCADRLGEPQQIPSGLAVLISPFEGRASKLILGNQAPWPLAHRSHQPLWTLSKAQSPKKLWKVKGYSTPDGSPLVKLQPFFFLFFFFGSVTSSLDAFGIKDIQEVSFFPYSTDSQVVSPRLSISCERVWQSMPIWWQ